MVPELARQAVIIKSKNQTSVILGNYECAYALGVLSKAAGLARDDTYTDMAVWHQEVMNQLAEFAPEQENVKQVLHMMRALEPSSEIDEQVRELYRMGYDEKRLWEI